MSRGAWAWFHDVWTCGAKVIEKQRTPNKTEMNLLNHIRK